MKTITIITLLIFLASCSSSKSLKSDNNNKTVPKKKMANPDHMSNAIEHFTNGKLLQSQGQDDAALNEFYEALLYDSNSPEIYKSISMLLIESGKYESALINIKKSLAIEPNDIEAFSMMANCHLQLRKLDLAIDNYLKILELNPRHEKAFEMLLNLYDFKHDMSHVNDLITKHSPYFESNANIAYLISSVYFKQKKSAIAKLWIDRSLNINPESEQAQLLAGEIDLAQGNSKSALESLYKLYEKDPKNDRLLFNICSILRQQNKYLDIINLLKNKTLLADQLKLILGESYYKTKQYFNVLSTISKIPLKQTDIYFLYIAADSEFQLKNYESSYGYYADIIKLKPEIAQGYYGSALCLIQQENFDEAEKVLRVGLRRTQEHNALYQLLTETLVNLNRQSEASDYLEDQLRKNPNDLNTMASVANAYQKMENFEKSDQIYETALIKDPNNAIILNNYSYSLSNRNIRLQDALKMIEKALIVSPNNHHYLDTIGWIYFKLQQFNKAKVFIEQAIITNPNDDSYEVYDHLGDIYLALKDKTKAIKYWERAIVIDPMQTQIKVKIDTNK